MEEQKQIEKLNDELLKVDKDPEEPSKRNTKEWHINRILVLADENDLELNISNTKLKRMSKPALQKLLGELGEKVVKFKITADSICQKDLGDKQKIDIELFEQGFDSNVDFPQPARLCFASGCCDNSYNYSGGYNMSLASNLSYDFRFDQAVKFKLVAVQLQRVRIDALGRITSTLD